MRCLILSGGQLIADAPKTLGQLIACIAAVHLPRHGDQLAALHATAA